MLFYCSRIITPNSRTYGFFYKNVVSEDDHEKAVADGVNGLFEKRISKRAIYTLLDYSDVTLYLGGMRLIEDAILVHLGLLQICLWYYIGC